MNRAVREHSVNRKASHNLLAVIYAPIDQWSLVFTPSSQQSWQFGKRRPRP